MDLRRDPRTEQSDSNKQDSRDKPPVHGSAVLGIAKPVISALTSQSRAATASSYEAGAERVYLHLTKYLPLTPSTSGDDAR